MGLEAPPSFRVTFSFAMGTSVSKPSPLAPPFERMETWDLKSSRRLLQDYKDKDLDFGLDAQGLVELLGGDKDWSESIIDAFRSPTGIINALAFICGACLVSSGPALEKAGTIFEALDFDGTEQISMDEMTISLLCCARGFCVIAGVGSIPSDEELESVTLQAYRDLNKGSTQSITKSEFTKWIMGFANGTGAPPTREVTLQDALEQFRVVPPAANATDNVESNKFDPTLQSSEAVDVLNHGEVETESEHANEWTAKQEHEVTDQEVELPKTIEPEYVPAEVDEVFTGGDEVNFTRQEDSSDVETEVYEGAPTDENDETQSHAESDAFGGQESQGFTSDIEPVASDAYEVGIEAQYYPEDTEYEYATRVVESAEPLQQGLLLNEAEDYRASGHEQSVLHAETLNMGLKRDSGGHEENNDSQHGGPTAASEGLVADEPQESSVAAPDDDDLVYEQDEFAEETPRVEAESDVVDVSTIGESTKAIKCSEIVEQSSPPAEAPIEFVSIEGGAEVTAAQEVDEQEIARIGTEVDEPSTPVEVHEQEPVENALTPEDAEAGDIGTLTEEPATVTDSADASPRTDLNAYDTYNFQSPRFDGSSGLPPPEPQELLHDSSAVGNAGDDTVGS